MKKQASWKHQWAHTKKTPMKTCSLSSQTQEKGTLEREKLTDTNHSTPAKTTEKNAVLPLARPAKAKWGTKISVLKSLQQITQPTHWGGWW